MSDLQQRRPNWGKKEWLEFSELQRREIQSVKKELERLNYWKGLENEIMDREDKVLAIEKDNERLREALEKIVKMPPYRESQHAMSFMDKFCEAHHIAEEALNVNK